MRKIITYPSVDSTNADVYKRQHLPFKGADLLYGLAQALDLGLVGAGECLFDELEHCFPPKRRRGSARAEISQYLL